MIFERNSGRGEGGNAIAREVSESSIREDIRYFEARIAEIGNASGSHERAMLRVYNSLLAHRRQMLAAYNDGRPEAWFEYEHVVL